MSNPNNCSTCDHKRHPQGGWCYAFRNEPDDVCMQHTGRNKPIGEILAHFEVKENGNAEEASRVQAPD
jgi:hypothetical protein